MTSRKFRIGGKSVTRQRRNDPQITGAGISDRGGNDLGVAGFARAPLEIKRGNFNTKDYPQESHRPEEQTWIKPLRLFEALPI